jgi:methionyl-tRNA formyltransferase
VSRAVVFAYHDVGVRCLAVLLAHGVEIPLVLTHRDDPQERVWFASVAELAGHYGIPVITPDNPNAPDVFAQIRSAQPEFLFSFYYRSMLGEPLLQLARGNAYNMHGSLLPKYRGRVPVNWAIIHGERETGATLHEMVAKPDAGRLVDQQAVPILPNDLAIDVFRKVTTAAEIVLDRALPALLSGTVRLVAQDLTRGSYFGGRRPDDGRIDWTKDAWSVHNLVRAVAPPYPGAFAYLDGRRVGLSAAQPFDGTLFASDVAAGTIVDISVARGTFVVKTVDGSLLVTEFDGVSASDLRLGARLAGATTAPDFTARYGKDIPRSQWEIVGPISD